VIDSRRRIISDPPMIVPIEEVFADVQADAIYAQIRAVLDKYRRSLESDRRQLLEQFRLVQVKPRRPPRSKLQTPARKAVVRGR
jgi:hypothetical protein